MGLKESKKWEKGSIHENGGGKFEILDRWFDEESKTIMLKYKFENGTVEENKEANVNASEWKWRKVRGLAGRASIEENSPLNQSINSFEDRLDGVYDGIHNLNATQMSMEKQLITLVELVKIQQKQIELLVQQNQNTVAKLLEKI